MGRKFFAKNTRLIVTSDWHLGYNNFYKHKLNGRSPMRPQFKSAYECESLIFKNLSDAIISNTDVLLCLGDSTMKPELLSRLDNLKCRKLLVMGNHDQSHGARALLSYFDDCFGVLIHKNLIFTHVPIISTEIPRHSINVHGHLHYGVLNGPYQSACLEVNNYKPVIINV